MHATTARTMHANDAHTDKTIDKATYLITFISRLYL